jgi:hypothetical protein
MSMWIFTKRPNYNLDGSKLNIIRDGLYTSARCTLLFLRVSNFWIGEGHSQLLFRHTFLLFQSDKKEVEV